jgi:hypothetical protein
MQGDKKDIQDVKMEGFFLITTRTIKQYKNKIAEISETTNLTLSIMDTLMQSIPSSLNLIDFLERFSLCPIKREILKLRIHFIGFMISSHLRPHSSGPLSLPTPQGRRDSQLGTMPKREIPMLRKATPRTWRSLRQT